MRRNGYISNGASRFDGDSCSNGRCQRRYNPCCPYPQSRCCCPFCKGEKRGTASLVDLEDTEGIEVNVASKGNAVFKASKVFRAMTVLLGLKGLLDPLDLLAFHMIILSIHGSLALKDHIYRAEDHVRFNTEGDKSGTSIKWENTSPTEVILHPNKAYLAIFETAVATCKNLG